ncbi:MAG: hypothetical protein HYU97_01145, partial [Deltaproteobacteria bacterium]|nr:hypothetical protein [Deltaproteobacteria bacterium]
MKKLLTLMSGVVFTILLSISSMSQAQVLKKPTPTGVINAVDFSVDSYKVDLMDLSSLDPCQRAKAHAKRVLRKFSHSCSDAWEAAANLAVDEALEQCSG